ncbi:serine/threonine-protein kinase [Gemmatimonas sp. UBA7669]|uniref:serine/threonine-protein kinase n=1 Tax=Gemmatimonas sp. UBA7669 TaxID=1946568 RepID=UPI0025B9A567|nr:serine/threonine-protein kinase [Gemmatimonas sp. UBA7669]
MIDRVVGNYQIVQRLGDGGMGTVYRAVDRLLERDVAIKVLRPELGHREDLVDRFLSEARALARLNHPHIAILHGLERHDGELHMVMEFVRGETLEQLVERSGALPWTRVVAWCMEALDALDHAHDMGVVHRDIKPANIMVSSAGVVKVMDFGIARLRGQHRRTQTGHTVGTPLYMAPEQLRGEEVDARTDVYAMGAVLFELVTGRVPFEADSDYALILRKLQDTPPPLQSLVPGTPAVLNDIVQRAMQHEPDARFPTAQAFSEALERVRAEYTVASGHTPPASGTAAAAAPLVSTSAAASRPGLLARIPLSALLAACAVLAAGVGYLAIAPAPARSVDGASLDEGSATATRTLVDPDPRALMPQRDITGRLIGEGSGAVTTPLPPPRSEPPPPVRGGEQTPPSRTAPVRPPTKPPVAVPDPTPAPTPVESAVTGERESTRLASREAPTLSAAESAVRIRGAVSDAVGVLGTRDGAARLLRGDARDAWLALASEQRISASVNGDADVALNGNEATAVMPLTVTVRSPFGANRRQSARAQAELSLRNGTWHVTSVRLLDAVTLR